MLKRQLHKTDVLQYFETIQAVERPTKTPSCNILTGTISSELWRNAKSTVFLCQLIHVLYMGHPTVSSICALFRRMDMYVALEPHVGVCVAQCMVFDICFFFCAYKPCCNGSLFIWHRVSGVQRLTDQCLFACSNQNKAMKLSVLVAQYQSMTWF